MVNGLCDWLGELYAAQGKWDKAAALCKHYIDAYTNAKFANEKYKQELINKFRKRLDEAEERLVKSPQQ